jgi:anti-sigma factor RsiW
MPLDEGPVHEGPVEPASCESIEELLSAYLDGELTEGERRRVVRHLASCPGCAKVFEELRAVSERVHTAILHVEVPAALEAKVFEHVARLHQRDQVRRLSVFYLVGAVLCVAAVAGLLASPFGMFFRVLLRLALTVFRGGVILSSSMSHLWMVGFVIFCVLLGGFSILAVSRVLRTMKSEAVV